MNRKKTGSITFVLITVICLLQSFINSSIAYGQINSAKKAGGFTDTSKISKILYAINALTPLITKYAADNHFPSLSYGVVADGKLIYTGNYGYTNISKNIRAGEGSEFRIASMTKSFTAMSILRLRDEGKLKLDDPVYLYIPEMKIQHYPTEDSRPATIRDLLSHAAGFPEDNPWGDRQLADTDEDLINLIKSGISFSNDPGIKYEYSNLGFAMLGYIIKRVTGKSYAEYIAENILLPLGMYHTYFEYSKVRPELLAHGYRWINGEWVDQPLLHDGSYGAMGGMITSIEDFSKYMIFHLSAWPPSDQKESGPLKRSSLREMQHPWNVPVLNADFHFPDGRLCPVVSSYAFGLRWDTDCEGRVLIGHSGGLPGFGSQWRILPDYGLGIVSFSNLTYASAGNLNLIILDSLIHLAGLQPEKLPVSLILQKRKEQLMEVIPEWKKPIPDIFAQNFFMDYSIEALRKEAKDIFEKAGKIVTVGEMVPQNNLRGTFDLQGEKMKIRVSFTLTPEHDPKIQEFHLVMKD